MQTCDTHTIHIMAPPGLGHESKAKGGGLYSKESKVCLFMFMFPSIISGVSDIQTEIPSVLSYTLGQYVYFEVVYILLWVTVDAQRK